jgi:uncharacterized protein (TIGR00369 family)
MRTAEYVDDGMCFACGTRNPQGLGLRFRFDSREVAADVTFGQAFQGYRGIVHGGLISTVLDEAMVTLLSKLGVLAVTAELTVRFVAPARVGEPFRVTARLVEKRGRISKLEARLVGADGTEIARARSTYFRLGSLSSVTHDGASAETR